MKLGVTDGVCVLERVLLGVGEGLRVPVDDCDCDLVCDIVVDGVGAWLYDCELDFVSDDDPLELRVADSDGLLQEQQEARVEKRKA